MSKIVESGPETRKKIIKGINKLADIVSSTLGPNGRNVVYNDEYGNIVSTKDGVSIAKKIRDFEDPIEDLGAQMIKQSAIKTGDSAGDGTTTSTVLAQNIINLSTKYINNGSNATEVKRGIDDAVSQVVKFLKKNISTEIGSKEQIEQIATISANNDESIGKIMNVAMDKVGREGIITIEESRTGETYLETVEGMQFSRGYKSPYFVTNNDNMTSNLEKPKILIFDGKINQAKDLLPILNDVSQGDSSLLIIAEDIDGEALATLIVNKMRGILKVCAVKAPDFGERRTLILEDIAIMTGGTVVSPNKGMRLDKFDTEWFGECRKATISKDQTTLVDGAGDEKQIESHSLNLQKQIEVATSPYEVEKLQERLAKMVGGVAIINVGGNTELEIKEKKDRVDDALHATRAAIEEGIVPGGGVALLYARKSIDFPKSNSIDYNHGKKIVYETCASPFVKILANAGYSEIDSYKLVFELTSGKVNYWKGYNLKTEKFVNMKDAGIIDPLKVTKNALENASSVAGTVLLTEAVVVDKPEAGKATSVEGYNPEMM
jgi:chaperonin GroEL